MCMARCRFSVIKCFRLTMMPKKSLWGNSIARLLSFYECAEWKIAILRYTVCWRGLASVVYSLEVKRWLSRHRTAGKLTREIFVMLRCYKRSFCEMSVGDTKHHRKYEVNKFILTLDRIETFCFRDKAKTCSFWLFKKNWAFKIADLFVYHIQLCMAYNGVFCIHCQQIGFPDWNPYLL